VKAPYLELKETNSGQKILPTANYFQSRPDKIVDNNLLYEISHVNL